MSRQLHVPHRSRSDSLADVADAARALHADEDRAIVRQLVLGAAADGVATVGGLLDKLEKLGPAQRRSLLDQARVRAGLPTIGEVDAQRAHEARQRALTGRIERDESGRAFQGCHADGCKAHPHDPITGGPVATVERRWFCEQHRAEVRPGDMDPWSPGVRYSACGAIEFGPEVDAERGRAEAEEESRRRRRAAKDAERAAVAETQQRHEAGMAAHYAPPPGFPS